MLPLVFIRFSNQSTGLFLALNFWLKNLVFIFEYPIQLRVSQCSFKIPRWLDSKRGPLVSENTALPIEPQICYAINTQGIFKRPILHQRNIGNFFITSLAWNLPFMKTNNVFWNGPFSASFLFIFVFSNK